MIIRQMVAKYRTGIALALGCYMVQVAMSSISPLFLTRLVDELAKQQEANPNILGGAVFFILTSSGLRIALGFVLARHLGRLSIRMATDLRIRLIACYLSAPKNLLPETGDFLTVSSRDTHRLMSFITGDLNSILVSVASFIGVSVVLANMNFTLYVLVIVFLPLYVLAYKTFAQIRYQQSLQIRDKHAVLTDRMVAAAKNQRTIYLHRGQEIVKRLLGQRIDDCNEAELKGIFVNSWSVLLLSGISFLMSAVTFGLGTGLVLNGRATVGMLLAFTTYSGSLLAPVSSITNMALSWQETRVAVAKIAQYINLGDHDAMLPTPVNMSGVSFAGAQFQQGNMDLTYEMKLGRLTSIVGLTGSGKSTICECLAGYLAPIAGTVMYTTPAGASISPQHMRQNVVLVDSKMCLFDDESILLNLTLGSDQSCPLIDAVIEAVEMQSLLLERGLDLATNVRKANFSQGETQRLLLARALLAKPSIVILDEALSGVHPTLCERILKGLNELVPRVIVISHRLSDHAQSEIVHCVEGGRIFALSFDAWTAHCADSTLCTNAPSM